MLPTSRTYLLQGGFSEHDATVLQLCLFYFGIVALRLFSMLVEFVGLGHQHGHSPVDEHANKAVDRVANRLFQRYIDEDQLMRSPCDTSTARLALGQSASQSLLVDVESAPGLGKNAESSEPLTFPEGVQQAPGCSRDVKLASRSDSAGEHASSLYNKPSLAEGLQNEIEDDNSGSRPRWLETSQRPSCSLKSSQGHSEDIQEISFLQIGLQSSIAIALHKIPEGFIIFSANQVDANLGLATFVTLFIHNLMEGFTMSLSLYMALRSRTRAVFWALLIGCGSQPLGAAMAIIWFKTGGDARKDLYGGLFAVTAGVMISLAFSLYSEALVLTLRSAWCSWFVFLGMAIISSTFAWTTA